MKNAFCRGRNELFLWIKAKSKLFYCDMSLISVIQFIIHRKETSLFTRDFLSTFSTRKKSRRKGWKKHAVQLAARHSLPDNATTTERQVTKTLRREPKQTSAHCRRDRFSTKLSPDGTFFPMWRRLLVLQLLRSAVE
jgi:hypothetical protein